MLKKILGIFKKFEVEEKQLNDHFVDTGFNILINEPQKISDWSICQICLDIVENKTQDMPDSYWCCSECASEAIEIPYLAIDKFLKKYDTTSLNFQLDDWRKRDDLVLSYKKLKELRYLKLIELKNVT